MRYLFILNPTAGKKNSSIQLRPAIEKALRGALVPKAQYEIVVTEYAGHARALAEAAAKTGEEVCIFTAGGDGTLNEALRGAQGYSNAVVGCLPYGSGNDFLRNFGTLEEFRDLQAQLEGGAVDIDMIDSTGGLSAMICAAGIDAQVAYGIPKFRRIPFCGGEMAYMLSIVEQVCGHIGRRLAFDIDGEQMEVDCLLCAVCNGRAYGGGFQAAPEAVVDDGWLDVFIVRTVSRLTIAKMLDLYKKGRHFKDGKLTPEAEPYFIYRRARKVTLHPVDGRGPIIATADGECGPLESLTAEIMPLAGRVWLPKPAFERFNARKAVV